MEKSMHINESIPVTENRKTGEVFCGHDDHAGYIYKFIQWGIV